MNLNEISDEVEACFESGTVKPVVSDCVYIIMSVLCTGDLSAAKECLARMKYFVNIEELLKEVLDLPS